MSKLGDDEHRRILQEVGCADGWKEVESILWDHRDWYGGLSLRDRETFNEEVRDAIRERSECWQSLGDAASSVIRKLEQ